LKQGVLKVQSGAPYRFLIAGGAAALVNWLARFPLELVMPFAAALLGATAIGMTCGFLLYQGWVFPRSDRPLTLQIRDFVLVNLAGQLAMFLVAVLLREVLLMLGFSALLAGALAHMMGIAVGAVVNYLGHRYVTFARSSHADPS
jgi:putative flippase GtrA